MRMIRCYILFVILWSGESQTFDPDIKQRVNDLVDTRNHLIHSTYNKF